jgi:hypothetical protein
MAALRRAGAAAVLGIVLLASACSSGGGEPSGTLKVNGQVEVAGSANDWHQVTGTVKIGPGKQVRVIDGTATLALGEARQVTLRKGSQLQIVAATGTAKDRPTLVAGDLLAEAGSTPLTINAGDSDVAVSGGAARVSRGLTVDVGSYTGSSTISSAGRQLVVPALHQATVPAVGLLPSRPAPLSYNPADAWDQRFLGDAIQLGDELAARSRGFTAQIPNGQSENAAFYRDLLPSLASEPELDSSLPNPGRTPGETLVGLAITAEGTKGSFSDRLQEVFGFHDEGAAWGVVALDQGVTRVKILDAVDQAIGRGPSLAAEAPVAVTAPASRSSRSSSSSASAAAPPSSGSQSSSETAQSPAASSSTPPVNAGPLRTGIPLLDTTVNNLVDVLSGLLGALGR